MSFERGEDVVPERRFLRRLNLRQIEHERRSRRQQGAMVVDDVERGVDDGGRESGAISVADVPVVEMKAARAEYLRGEVELRPPIANDRPLQHLARPLIHLGGNLLGHLQENLIPLNGQAEVSLVVQRHRAHLPEGVFAVEHPAVGAGEQRVGDVANAGVDGRAGPGRRTGTLNPLALEIPRNLAAREGAGPGIADRDRRARNVRIRIEERDSPAIPCAIGPSGDARGHHGFPVGVERGQRAKRIERRLREDIGVLARRPAANLQESRS